MKHKIPCRIDTARSGRAKQGIALIDLVVAVLIVGIVSAVGGVRYASALQTYRLRQAAQRIAVDIESARHAARNRRQVVTIVFDPAKQSYTSSGINDPDHPAAVSNVNLQDIASSISLTSAAFGSGATLRFNEFGNPDNGGSVVVSSGGDSIVVSVSSSTGSVSVP